MARKNDPLHALLAMSVEEVCQMVLDATNSFVEEEGLHPLVARARAMEEVSLWYEEDGEKQLLLIEMLDNGLE